MARASNLAIIYRNFADLGTLSGGNWQAGSLGLPNLQTPYLAEVARSLDTTPASTRFDADLGRVASIGGIAFGPTTARTTATFRVRAWYDAQHTSPLYDSGVISFPGVSVDSLELEWEEDGFWAGISDEVEDQGKGITVVHLTGAAVVARYWAVEIFDEGNPAGFIEVGRLIIGSVWQPVFNYSYDGNEFGLDPLTDMEEGRSGVRFFNPRNQRRTFSFSFPYLPEDETFGQVYRLATRSGTHNHVVVVPSPDDTGSYQREAFIGTLGVMPSLRRAAPGLASTSFKIEEAL